MTICAYCRNDRPATREHVIPSFMYSLQRQLAESFSGWNENAQRMVGGEAKVKDVCASCNNGPLADLDAYAKHLLSGCGLLSKNYAKRSLTFQYEYTLLLRWLLKTSYNSSRTDGVHAPAFEEYIPFMLGLAPAPPRHQVACMVSLAAPELLSAYSSPPQSFVDLADGCGLVNPFFVRISYGALPRELFLHRLVIIGPAIFQMALFKPGVLPGHAASSIRALLKVNPIRVELTEKRSYVGVSAGSATWLDLFQPQLARARAAQKWGSQGKR